MIFVNGKVVTDANREEVGKMLKAALKPKKAPKARKVVKK